MARPSKDRIVGFNPDTVYFKPRGIPLRNLEEVVLGVDECEAVRLADLLGLSHEDAGREMGISRATFGRIVQQARKTIADALINGRAIRIEGGNYRYVNEDSTFVCGVCRHHWKVPYKTDIPGYCPECQRENIHRL